MLKVANGKCIRRLGNRSMRASRQRNIVAVLAIALTTVLFTSLFTIVASINYSYQQENFRQAGGDGHGTVKNVSYEQLAELRDDPLIQEAWGRLFVGMITAAPFNKSHVEVSYIEPAGAPHYFCTPAAGALPREGTDEVATDTHILALLGVEPQVGAEITLPIVIDENTSSPKVIERSFTLSGWWEYDSAVVANNVLLPRSTAEELAAQSGGGLETMTGRWNLDVKFKNSFHIRENLSSVLENHGYQCGDPGAENYLRVGVNWGYTGDKLGRNLDPVTAITITAILLLIVFTGYLIIYNVFQISVTNDIRFYGLLKTIGTTGRQLKRVIRRQALLLSLAGIPLGLVLGFIVGNRLTPIIMAQLSYKNAFVTFNPWIFAGAAGFSLLTTFLSCARPGRIAAKVSPVEAVRYTDSNRGGDFKGRRGGRRGQSGVSLPRMAWANLGRSRSKTVVTVLSLALAVVLMNITFTFANGFDMEKYLAGNVASDYVVGHADYFSSSAGFHSVDDALPEDIIADIREQEGIVAGGRIYGQERGVQQLMPEEFLRQEYARWAEFGQRNIETIERIDEQTLVGETQLYGMEDFALSKLDLLAGDLAPLTDPTRDAIAAVYGSDDYNEIVEGSNWAKLGDEVTLRYVSEWGYIDLDTGEEISGDEVDARFERGEDNFAPRAKVYVEKTYTVCALVEVPAALSYRYKVIGASSLVMGAEQFLADTGMDSVMIYAFDTAEEASGAVEDFLAGYTDSVQPIYDFESKQSIMDEFAGFRNMVLTMGGALAGVVGLVGVLNFINAVLTGILARKREFAVLQAVGMTGGQLKGMLVFEGTYYTVLSVAVSLLLAGALAPLMGSVCSIFWFFTYRFTVLPVLLVIPPFLLLGILVPLSTYRAAARHAIVERLREAE